MCSLTPSAHAHSAGASAFPKTGIKISILQALRLRYAHSSFDCSIDYYDSSKGLIPNKPFAEMTTTDVCEVIIKPTVKDHQCSYCDYLSNILGQHDCVGPATVFISHAWKYTFVDVISSLEHHFQDRDPDILIWFDLFSNNQIIAPTLDFTWWSSTFKSAIEDFGYVVVICLPWNHPVPFRRAWCLFEVYCAIVTNSTFEVAMSKNEHDSFLLSIVDDVAEYYNMLSNIQVLSSECWKEDDRASIFAFVDTLPDKSNTVNSLICDRMRSWITSSLLKEIAVNGNDEALKADLKTALGSVYAKQARFEEAIQILDEALATHLSLEGKGKEEGEERGGVKVAKIWYLKGTVWYSHGIYEDSLACFNSALSMYISEQGEEHEDVAMVCNYIGLVLSSNGQSSLAADQFTRALSIYEGVYGTEYTSYLAVADVFNHAAANHSHMGDHELALSDYQQALVIQQSKLGEDHPDVATTYKNIANVYTIQSNQEEALRYYDMALTIRRSKLGEEHPFVGQTYNNMANAYRSLNQYSKALEYYKKALANRKARLGHDHPDVARTLNNMALLYVSLKKINKALEYYAQSLEIRKQKFGDGHHSVASTLNNIANAYSSNKDDERALSYYEEALSIRKDLYGENHLEVAKSLFKLGNCHRSLTRFKESLECYKRALAIREDKLGSDDKDTQAVKSHMHICQAQWDDQQQEDKNEKNEKEKKEDEERV